MELLAQFRSVFLDYFCHYANYHVEQPLLCRAIDTQANERRSLFVYGLNTGGPGVITVGWIVVGGFSRCFQTLLKSLEILLDDSALRC